MGWHRRVLQKLGSMPLGASYYALIAAQTVAQGCRWGSPRALFCVGSLMPSHTYAERLLRVGPVLCSLPAASPHRPACTVD